jgi:2-isopropylmalate synthase
VDEIANVIPNRRLPFVGAASFAHKGGIHAHAVAIAPSTYEHIDPALVGNERHVLISELSGRGNVLEKARRLGLELDKDSPAVRAVVRTIKELESQGFQFEDAEASFELLVRRTRPDYRAPFELLDFVVLSEKRGSADILAEATVKLRVQGELVHTAAEGNGPVNALDAAMRKALLPVYPRLADVTLTDYKVRVLEGDAGTAAAVPASATTNGTGRKPQRHRGHREGTGRGGIGPRSLPKNGHLMSARRESYSVPSPRPLCLCASVVHVPCPPGLSHCQMAMVP